MALSLGVNRCAGAFLLGAFCLLILSMPSFAEEEKILKKNNASAQEPESEVTKETSEKEESDKESEDSKEKEGEKKDEDSDESESPNEKALEEDSNQGITLKSTITLDNTWSSGGGRPTPYYGAFEGTFEVGVTIKSEQVFYYPGGIIFVDFQSHHGREPSKEFVGSFVPVLRLEAPDFDQLYALWYKQKFGERVWFLVGKSDANDNFENVTHAYFFENAGYLGIPTIPFFPSYPNPALSLIGSVEVGALSFTFGIFEGSSATRMGSDRIDFFGDFFDADHAFLIGEVNAEWEIGNALKGRFGIGGWHHTGKFNKFSGREKRGTSGAYFTIDQILYLYEEEEVGFFFIFGVSNPAIIAAHYYTGTGLTWEGFNICRPKDIVGLGMSRAYFTHAKSSGFTEPHETSYEIFYLWRFCDETYLQPDFQYIVHPGGRGLPNACVFNLALQLTF